MSYHDIVILFPGHGLEDFPTDLPDEKAAGLLNAFAVAWHPALLAAVQALPGEHRADVPPSITAERLILVPPACDELVPAGWIEQARAEGATVITGISERDELVRVLLQSPGLSTSAGAAPLDADLVADFFALGACRLQLELLTRRMHHYSTTDDAQLRRSGHFGGRSGHRGRRCRGQGRPPKQFRGADGDARAVLSRRMLSARSVPADSTAGRCPSRLDAGRSQAGQRPFDGRRS